MNQLTTKLLRLAPNIICKFSPNLLFDILLHEVTSAGLRLNPKLYTQVTRRKCAAPRRLRPAASSPGWRVSSTKSKQNQVYYRGAICAQQTNCYNNGRATFYPKNMSHIFKAKRSKARRPLSDIFVQMLSRAEYTLI